MRKLGVVLLIVIAFGSYADKGKAAKSKKDKRFEPVAVLASNVAGSYRGPNESYGLILEQANDGSLRGNYVEMGRVAVLNGIVLSGESITAQASFADGSSRTVTGVFADRILNGKRAFGLLMNGIPIEGMGAAVTFFERF